MPEATAQPSLFGLEDASALPVAVSGSPRQLSKAQKEFNRLSAGLESARRELETLQGENERLRQRWLDESAPRLAALDRAIRALIADLDATLRRPPPGAALRKRGRQALTDYLLELIEERLERGDGRDRDLLEAIYDRHSEVSLSDLREEHEAGLRDELESFAEELGIEVEEDSDEDALREHIEEALRARAAAEAAEATQRAEKRRQSRPAKERAAAARREQALHDAGQSLRDVFRRLASALHPDRETDPAERARKTELMQQANRAYEAKDLMALFRLQVEADQLDPERLAAVPEERLRGYSLLLKEQLATIRAEIANLQSALLDVFDMPYAALRRFDTRSLDHSLNEQLADLRRIEQAHLRERELLASPGGLRVLLVELSERQRQADLEEADALAALFDLIEDDMVPAGRQRQAARGRKGKRA
ncbi:J domain-containing protein [Pseudomarimonas salicorniae]|uniref:J domain-containing protein n=1 Tax=Pseudomarimonas salicorniae TaxID=2933270 RepID=A0ABT0GLB3_9GAMM|nr:J domain-containing protein [Lysobacter sp. CAU 1642]MCK7595340.1 J domain-containing protein [Lysobacter sp. CAU 1642]